MTLPGRCRRQTPRHRRSRAAGCMIASAPIHVFNPMCRRRRANKLRADFRIRWRGSSRYPAIAAMPEHASSPSRADTRRRREIDAAPPGRLGIRPAACGGLRKSRLRRAGDGALQSGYVGGSRRLFCARSLDRDDLATRHDPRHGEEILEASDSRRSREAKKRLDAMRSAI